MPVHRLWLALWLLPLTASADWVKFEADFDGERPWQEIQAQLPTAPGAEKLLPFYVSAATDNLFFIDATSVSVGADGVVRYALLVKSVQGASNLTFEGMRCTTHERRIYAFGRADGTWSKARQAKWEAIRYQDRNRHHHVLFDDFFCPDGIAVGKPEQALDALKRERPR
jgi:hypothetical protein